MHQERLQTPRTAAGDEFYPRAQLSGACLAERASPWYWHKRGFQSKCLQEEPGDKVEGVRRAPAPPSSISARTYRVAARAGVPFPVISELLHCHDLRLPWVALAWNPISGRSSLWSTTPTLGCWVGGWHPCHWCKHMEEFWGKCAGALGEPCG